jgi:hypothetical protein
VFTILVPLAHRAVVERHRHPLLLSALRGEEHLPSIAVRICAGEDDVTIRITDQVNRTHLYGCKIRIDPQINTPYLYVLHALLHVFYAVFYVVYALLYLLNTYLYVLILVLDTVWHNPTHLC